MSPNLCGTRYEGAHQCFCFISGQTWCLSSMRKFLKQMQNRSIQWHIMLSLKTHAIEEEVLKVVLLVIRYHDSRQCDGTVLMKTSSVCSKVLCHSDNPAGGQGCASDLWHGREKFLKIWWYNQCDPTLLSTHPSKLGEDTGRDDKMLLFPAQVYCLSRGKALHGF